MSGAAAQLRALLAGDGLIVAPGVSDGLSARLVERAGFLAVYASGGAIARSMALPDLGLLSMSEVVGRLRPIVDAVGIPVIADADDGYGNALNVRRTVAAFEQAGVAALHLEDQLSPKRCGHLDDKTLIPAQDFAQKIAAARDAATDPDLVIIARTDAIAVEGFAAAIARARLYGEAGADVLFVEAPETEQQIERIAEELPGPNLINMFHGGKTPLLPADRLGDLGYRIVIIPSDLQRAAMHAMEEVLRALKHDGDSHSLSERMVSFQQREEIVGTADLLELGDRYKS
jgi:2-methylisocitrate lyase-like PEP mutase family enzyme